LPPPALQRGVVEGVFTASAGGGKIWGELLTHNYRLGPNYFESFVIANKDAFKALPAESQAALRRIVGEVAPTITATMAREEAEVTAALKAKGMTVTEARAEDVAAASKRMADFWDEWAKAKGPEHVEALAKVRAAIGK
jgi:TRAP-type C4-dicarboxylate transport system substrate-binding protein